MTAFHLDHAAAEADARAELARMRDAIRAGMEELDAGAARIAVWTADQERLGAVIDAKQRAADLLERALDRYRAPGPVLSLVNDADRFLSALRDEREDVHVEQDDGDPLDACFAPAVTARSCPR